MTRFSLENDGYHDISWHLRATLDNIRWLAVVVAATKNLSTINATCATLTRSLPIA